jgi:hypothetical protein
MPPFIWGLLALAVLAASVWVVTALYLHITRDDD